MFSILLILTFVGQGLGMGSEQERVHISGLTQYKQLAGSSNRPLLHSGASVVNQSTEPPVLELDAEGLARSLPSEDSESIHDREVAIITRDAARAAGNSIKLGHKLPSSTDLREQDPSHAEKSVITIHAEEADLAQFA
ncbi:hypothetical protein PCANC_01033 [Puccinia coronata f. sp. avenae]|uniref:Uncharacterized protein n=1 Tax=Puccinia coronata f. sp. avenae TaxID=200324 RepID=A0A2N5W6I0_9BASI|nr:hypothetical protein PCANC_01033 [Puccinia coronata f. sp. avenae]